MINLFPSDIFFLIKGSFVPTKPKEQPIVIADENEMKDVLGSLPMPEYDLHKGLLLGKKSSKGKKEQNLTIHFSFTSSKIYRVLTAMEN